MLDNTPNQPSKFRTSDWIEINDNSWGAYNTSSQIKFKTRMLKSSYYSYVFKLSDYSDACILVKGNIIVVGARATDTARQADRINKQAIFKNCALFTDYITETNSTQADNAKDIDVVMPMYNLIENSGNYSKTSGSLRQYCRDEPNNNITDSESLKLKSRFLDNTNNAGIIDAKIAVPLKYLSKFWRAFEMPLINCEVYLILTSPEERVIYEVNTTFKTTDTKPYVPVVTLSINSR